MLQITADLYIFKKTNLRRAATKKKLPFLCISSNDHLYPGALSPGVIITSRLGWVIQTAGGLVILLQYFSSSQTKASGLFLKSTNIFQAVLQPHVVKAPLSVLDKENRKI